MWSFKKNLKQKTIMRNVLIPSKARIWFSYKVRRNELTAQHLPFFVTNILWRSLIWIHLIKERVRREFKETIRNLQVVIPYLLSTSWCLISKLTFSIVGFWLSAFSEFSTLPCKRSPILSASEDLPTIYLLLQNLFVNMKFHGYLTPFSLGRTYIRTTTISNKQVKVQSVLSVRTS